MKLFLFAVLVLSVLGGFKFFYEMGRLHGDTEATKRVSGQWLRDRDMAK